MLLASLQLFHGISAKKEKLLWLEGVSTWDALETRLSPQMSLLSGNVPRSSAFGRSLSESRRALEGHDVAYFGNRLDRAEHFRIALTFPEDFMFLDIETTGLSRYYDQITVIGWCLAGKQGFAIQGQSDLGFRDALRKAKGIVTFNGSLFDVPFIKEALPKIEFPQIHIDLRFLAKRIGLTGGQKRIELEIGVDRGSSVKNISGEFAPVLWHRYVAGDLQALRSLLLYNSADILGMISIFSYVVRKIALEKHMPVSEEKIFSVIDSMSARPTPPSDSLLSEYLLPYPKTSQRRVIISDLLIPSRRGPLKVIGIDLTGSEKRPSGWCLLSGHEAKTARINSDDELIALSIAAGPHLISIDSPLSLPSGRICVEDSDPGRAQFGIIRYCERVLKRRGVNVYPALLPSMQRLTARGIALAERFRKLGLPVIESYPGAAQDIMRIPRKRKGLEYLEQGLKEFGVTGDYCGGSVSHDELDAITSAIVGVFFWASKAERIGPDPFSDEALIIPDLRVDSTGARNRLVVGISGALGAGKTTAARHLESIGFRYCRYSEVIERLVKLKGPSYTREDLQVEGQRVHEKLGQRWLGRELLQPMLNEALLVIDGLRFPEDYAFLRELYGAQFLHLHVTAPRDIRRLRFARRQNGAHTFDMQDGHSVESQHDKLGSIADFVLLNHGPLDGYYDELKSIISMCGGK